MGTIRNRKNDPKPLPDTKVIFRKGHDANWVDRHKSGDIVYVTSHSGLSDAIVVSANPGRYHGEYCSEWEEIVDAENVLTKLSDEEKDTLSRAALDAAKSRGYCDETKKILTDLGLPVPPPRRKVTVELEVEEDLGYQFYAYNIVNRWNDSGNGKVRIISATEK